MERISIVGLGKLGACTAACFASKGFEVIGVDTEKGIVDSVNNGVPPVCEPNLKELMELSKPKLSATLNYAEAIEKSDVTFLVVPTPSKNDGNFSNQFIEAALIKIAEAMKSLDKTGHLIVITSTVTPRSIEDVLIPLIEKASGKICDEDFDVCYNPEFIALGTVIRDFLNPDMVLIGENRKEAGDRLQKIYEITCENKPYMARMSLTSSEITKISLNSYITMKISFANTLTNICEAIPGADIDAITMALGSDMRIGEKYLKGAVSYGGPCFPRDNKAFASFAKKYGVDVSLAEATDKVNDYQLEHIIGKIMKCLGRIDSKKVSVLGLSYKPKTPVIEEAFGVKVIEALLQRSLNVMVYDPLAMKNAKLYFEDKVLYSSSVKDCFKHGPLVIITTPDNDFKCVDKNYIFHEFTTIIDCWRILDPSGFGNKVNYIPLGISMGERDEY